MEFDYVIVGGGSAGCVLAGRLSEDRATSVCLLESGGPDSSVLISAPLGFAAAAPIGLHASLFESVPQAGLNGRRSFQPRGKVLGGSSAVNAMVYCRGNPSDYDGWAALGNPGWAYADVLPYFKRAENSECFGAGTYHGASGPLNVSWLRSPFAVTDAFLAACESQGIARTPDYNGAQQEGCWPAQVTQKNGERCSAARAYVTPHLARSNLLVMTRAAALRLELQGRRAAGVQVYVDGKEQLVRARREVILAGGAFGSPQLLMCSGIGPATHLRELGIAVAHDLPGVGQNLQDHITASPTWRSRRSDGTFGISWAGATALVKGIFEWRRLRTGPITSNVAESGAFVRTSPERHAPDIQFALCIGIVDDHNRKMHLGHGCTLHITLSRPKSRGEVRLTSTDTRKPLAIDPRYFSHPDDMPVLVAGTKLGMQVMNAPALDAWRGDMLYPVSATDDADIEREIRRGADTEYHPCSTCRMGPASDAQTVVDAELRVHGIEALRVADASIMPTLTTGNTNAPTIMIGEKAADLIRGRGAPTA